MIETPTPYDDTKIVDHFWEKEPFDSVLPSAGFLTDFVLATRGIETPTNLCFWTAVWTLSSVLKRDAYFKWFPDPMYPNFFVVLVAPPRLCAKSTAVRQFGEWLLVNFTDEKYFKDPCIRFVKEVNLLRTKVTPEALEIALVPQEKVPIMSGDKLLYGSKGSEVSVVVSELATFLGKQKYNTGLINKLVDLYDCKDVDSSSTVGRKTVIFKNIFFTLIGATTIKGINESIPEEAMGGGFISRLIMVHAPKPTRSYPEPRGVEGGPDRDELTKRLAWIANNAQGEYYFSDKAKTYYEKLYKAHRKKLMNEDDDTMDMKSRFDIHLRKLALILKAQRYEEGNEISVEILKEAEAILEMTYIGSQGITKDVGTSSYTQAYTKVKQYIQDKRKITRRQLIMRFSSYGYSAELILKVIQHIHQEGLIEITVRGKRSRIPSILGEEVYEWDK